MLAPGVTGLAGKIAVNGVVSLPILVDVQTGKDE
jgi:hypothetical protein